MMVKIVSLFLIFMVVLAMFGKLRVPKINLRRPGSLPKPSRCKRCGRMNVTGGACEACNDETKRR